MPEVSALTVPTFKDNVNVQAFKDNGQLTPAQIWALVSERMDLLLQQPKETQKN
jgi:hypothetical protein